MKAKISFFCVIIGLITSIVSCSSTPEPSVEVEGKIVTPQQLISENRFAEAKEMFVSRRFLNYQDENGNTPLHVAAMTTGADDMVSFLIDLGADYSILNTKGNTALHEALLNRNFKSASLLADTGNAIFTPDANGQTPVDYVISVNSNELTNSIISTVSGKILNENGQNIVHYFALNNMNDAIATCSQFSVPLSVSDKDGKTPLLLVYEKANKEPTMEEQYTDIETAASLIRAKCEPSDGIYYYFEKVVKKYNLNLRFNENQTSLHIAAEQGHLCIANWLLKNGAVTSVQNNTGATPLHIAVAEGNYKIAELLLNNNADINSRDSLSRTPLLLNIPEKTQKQMYTLLLNRKADTTAKDYLGNTCLHIATEAGVEEDILSALVEKGAEINARNEKGITPLAIAVDRNDVKQITFFIKQNADIHASDKDQKTPYLRALASINDTNGISLLKYVVNKTNIASRDSFGNTPLHLAIRKNSPIYCINYLLDCGADIDARNSAGESLLYMAVNQNNKEAGELLISKGADIYASDSNGKSPLYIALNSDEKIRDWFFCNEVLESSDGNGNTPLHYAVNWDDLNGIKFLLNAKADISKCNSAGETALFTAVRRNSAASINLLIKKGANPNARDFHLDTPLHHAVRGPYLAAIETLVKQNNIEINAKNLAGKTPLSQAVIANNGEVTGILISHGADVNAYDDTGVTIVMDAVQNKSKSTFIPLLDAKANVNLQDMNGRNAYHEAAKSKDIKIIKLLCQYGGNALLQDSYGKTPFSMLLSEKFSYVKAVLGTNRNLVDSNGNNPIHEAINCNSSENTLQQIINLGYNIDQRNGQGLSPLNLAISLNNKALAKILILNKADPFISDNVGECAITLCFSADNQDILDEIIKNTIETRKTDIYGQTILHYAARNASAETIKHIIDSGVDNSIKDNSGETAYDVAVRWKNNSVLEYLRIKEKPAETVSDAEPIITNDSKPAANKTEEKPADKAEEQSTEKPADNAEETAKE